MAAPLFTFPPSPVGGHDLKSYRQSITVWARKAQQAIKAISITGLIVPPMPTGDTDFKSFKKSMAVWTRKCQQSIKALYPASAEFTLPPEPAVTGHDLEAYKQDFSAWAKKAQEAIKAAL